MAEWCGTLESNLVFGTADDGGRSLMCDIYYPPEDSPKFPSLPSGKRVGILLVHGGALVVGSKLDDNVVREAKYLSQRGYVCVCSEYRLCKEAKWPSMIHDCKAAVRWMRVHADRLGISSDHICSQGASAGGHLALMLAACDGAVYPELEGHGGNAGVSSKVAACVAIYPPTHDKTIDPSVLPQGASDQDLLLLSPLTYVQSASTFPPVCFLHGNGDDRVIPYHSSKMYEELHARGFSAELHMFAHAPHGYDSDRRMFNVHICVIELFYDRLFRHECGTINIDPDVMSGGRDIIQLEPEMAKRLKVA